MTRGKHARPSALRRWLWRLTHRPYDYEQDAPEYLLPKPQHVRLVTQYPPSFQWRRP